jgi:hypothetical protein
MLALPTENSCRHVIELFISSSTIRKNKLERFYLDIIFKNASGFYINARIALFKYTSSQPYSLILV